MARFGPEQQISRKITLALIQADTLHEELARVQEEVPADAAAAAIERRVRQTLVQQHLACKSGCCRNTNIII